MLAKLLAPLALLTTALLSTSPAVARVTGITAPGIITPGTDFDVTFTTASFSENNEQYYVIFGLAPPGYDGLYHLLGKGYDLVANGHDSTGSGSFSVPVPFDSSFSPSSPGAEYQLSAVVFGTIGASEQIWTTVWNATVSVE